MGTADQAHRDWQRNLHISIVFVAGIKSPYQLVIDPKMAFGTGYHDTTRMVLETMEEMMFDNQSVLDFGCGTGILAVYASMRGASKVVGIDNDLVAVESARDVARANHQRIELRYQKMMDISMME